MLFRRPRCYVLPPVALFVQDHGEKYAVHSRDDSKDIVGQRLSIDLVIGEFLAYQPRVVKFLRSGQRAVEIFAENTFDLGGCLMRDLRFAGYACENIVPGVRPLELTWVT